MIAFKDFLRFFFNSRSLQDCANLRKMSSIQSVLLFVSLRHVLPFSPLWQQIILLAFKISLLLGIPLPGLRNFLGNPAQ